MEAIFGIAIVWCIAYGITRGTQGMGNAAKGAYRRRAAAWTGTHPSVGPLPVAAKLGAGVATALTGGVQVARGFAAGWRQGWPEGREKGQAWVQRREEARMAAASGYEPVGSYTPVPGSDIGWTGQDGPTEGAVYRGHRSLTGAPFTDADRRRIDLREDGYDGWVDQDGYAVSHPIWPSPKQEEGEQPPEGWSDKDDWSMPTVYDTNTDTDNATTPKGPDTMATTMTGEVLTYEHLNADLNSIAKEAAAELEDAQAAAKRAGANANRADLMVASLTVLDLDGQTLAEVSALADMYGAAKAAADARAAAADGVLAQAETAMKGLQARHSQLYEAHQATKHAADKPFYAA